MAHLIADRKVFAAAARVFPDRLLRVFERIIGRIRPERQLAETVRLPVSTPK